MHIGLLHYFVGQQCVKGEWKWSQYWSLCSSNIIMEHTQTSFIDIRLLIYNKSKFYFIFLNLRWLKIRSVPNCAELVNGIDFTLCQVRHRWAGRCSLLCSKLYRPARLCRDLAQWLRKSQMVLFVKAMTIFRNLSTLLESSTSEYSISSIVFLQ